MKILSVATKLADFEPSTQDGQAIKKTLMEKITLLHLREGQVSFLDLLSEYQRAIEEIVTDHLGEMLTVRQPKIYGRMMSEFKELTDIVFENHQQQLQALMERLKIPMSA